MVYKISMRRTVNDPSERRIRLNELFKVFEESKTAINDSVSQAGTLTAEKATESTKSQPKK